MGLGAFAQLGAHRNSATKGPIFSKTKTENFDLTTASFLNKAAGYKALQVKFSPWDSNTNSWRGEYQKRYSYLNGLLNIVITLDYFGIDTLARETHIYDAQKRKTEVLYEEFDGLGLSPKNRTSISYSGTELKATTETYEDFDHLTLSWSPTYRYTVIVDDRGNERQHKLERFLGKWELSTWDARHIEYFQNTAKQTLTVDSDMVWSNRPPSPIATHKVEKVYSGTGNVKKIYYSQRQGLHQPKMMHTAIDSFIYNGGDVVPHEIYHIKYDTTFRQYWIVDKYYNLGWEFFDINRDINEMKLQNYTVAVNVQGQYYDANQFSVIRPDMNGSYVHIWERVGSFNVDSISRYSKIFDSKKNLIEESRENKNFGTWEYEEATKWQNSYDMNGDLSQAILQRYDYFARTFENENKFEFSNYTNVLSGIGSNANTLQAIVYPNPSTDGNVCVKLTALSQGEVRCYIYTTNGQLVVEDSWEASVGVNTLNIPTLQTGFYIIKLESAEGVSQYKLNVQ
jgi:hypothetical protein